MRRDETTTRRVMSTRSINVAAYLMLEHNARLAGTTPAGRGRVRFELEVGGDPAELTASFSSSRYPAYLALREQLIDRAKGGR